MKPARQIMLALLLMPAIAGGEAAAPAAQPAAQLSAQREGATQEKVTQETAVQTEDAFVYAAQGKRSPFQPPLILDGALSEAPEGEAAAPASPIVLADTQAPLAENDQQKRNQQDNNQYDNSQHHNSQQKGRQYRGKRLSLDFQDIEVRSALQLLADFNNFNLVASDAVTGSITLRLKDIPWDQALDIILTTRGLGKRQLGQVLMIMPMEELAARVRQEQENSILEPLVTEFIAVKYADAAQVLALFTQPDVRAGESKGVISGRGSVIVDERTNTIILTDIRPQIDAFLAMLERIDVPVRQVLIEARIVTANANFSRNLGVRWGVLGANSHNKGKNLTHWGGSLKTLDSIRTATADGKALVSSKDALVVDLGRGSASSFAVGLVDEKFLLELEIDALETEGKGEVIARPKVITADRQQASIASGSQIPYQEASSSGATSTAFVDAVLGLTVTPRITPDDRIIMDLNVTQNSIGDIFNGVPSINTNNIQTQVRVDDGETIVLGGVFNTTSAESVSRTPVLGDLPVLGNLFKSRTKTEAKNELLIFITPRLLWDSLSEQ